LEDSHHRCPLKRFSGECRTRHQRLATVSRRFDQYHHPLVAASPEAAHLLEKESHRPTCPLHEPTHGIEGRFGYRPQECPIPPGGLTTTVKRVGASDDPDADLLLASHLVDDVQVREGQAGNESLRHIRGSDRWATAENPIHLLCRKAALHHGDLVPANSEAKIFLEKGHHHSADFPLGDFTNSQNVNPKSFQTVEDDTSGTDGPRGFQ
jgi:hypothetical protein